MAESCPRPRLTKIVLGVTILFAGIVVVCLAVGGPLYAQERSKSASYVKDLCYVRATTYETFSKCIVSEKRPLKYEDCHVPIWEVAFGQNGTLQGTVRTESERNFEALGHKSSRYKVGSSYTCWYNKDKPTQVTFQEPTTYYALILLIIGTISIPFAILSMIGYIRLKKRPDL